MSIKKDILWRIYLLFFMMTLAAVAIVVQGFRIQVLEGEHWRGLADSLTTRYHTISAERGNIFSGDGRLLATSLAYFELRMDCNAEALTDDIFYDNIDSLSIYMSRFFKDRSSADHKRRLINARKNGNRYLLIKRNVTFPELQEIKQFPLFRLGRYKGGLIVVQANKRKMPFGMLAHRTIGYVRTGPGAQSVGLEAEFDDDLAGVHGKRLMQKIAGNTWMPINEGNEIEPKNGSDIITTIDINIQDVAEYALLKSLREHNADHGSVIVMEVKTGKIKAIANLGKMPDGNYWEKYNYAIGEATEPGSTFKLATMMALLEDGLVSLEDSIDIGYGQQRFYNQIMRDAESHNHGKVTVQRAFEISSNVGLSKLANQHYQKDPKKYIDHLYGFHLNKKVGIEIKGEPMPLIKSPGDKGWSAVTVPWMSVGYEVLLTPLQTLSFYNAVANNGRMMKPYIVSEVQEYGKTIKKYEPEVMDEGICSPETIEKLHRMLIGVIDHGTAKNLKNANYKIAGKTGTAQIADNKNGYQKIYLSSFAGFFPADDPQYSCIVVVNAPSNGTYYGSLVAGPVFKEIADKIYSGTIDLYPAINIEDTLDSEPSEVHFAGYQYDLQEIADVLAIKMEEQQDEEWVNGKMDMQTLDCNGIPAANGKVPNAVGMGLKDAMYLLENSGLRVVFNGKGKVRKQSLKPGEEILFGSTIYLELY